MWVAASAAVMPVMPVYNMARSQVAAVPTQVDMNITTNVRMVRVTLPNVLPVLLHKLTRLESTVPQDLIGYSDTIG